MNHPMPKRPPRDWTVLTLMALLAVLIVASFATLPLKWKDFFTIEAVSSMLELLGGFAMLQYPSREAAIDGAKRFLEVAGDGECITYQLMEQHDC